MSHRPIIDAGPGLNFFSINKERLLIGVLGRLSAPETVQEEVFRKSRQDERFRPAAAVWRKLTPHWVEVLSDDQTPRTRGRRPPDHPAVLRATGEGSQRPG
ncbi:hypothetical protein JOF41_000191 [Saccharothrix coeruleofusca]|nr:hypothetical protein [Saccharothrix coeruleofusca]